MGDFDVRPNVHNTQLKLETTGAVNDQFMLKVTSSISDKRLVVQFLLDSLRA
jgi:hypothetical protein